MGAWGYEVLSNDSALDEMSTLEELSGDELYEYVNRLLDGSEPHQHYELLLGVELIDISLNGIDASILGYVGEYRNWLNSIVGSDLKLLKSKAITQFNWLWTHDDGWVNPDERKAVLLKIRDRLNK